MMHWDGGPDDVDSWDEDLEDVDDIILPEHSLQNVATITPDPPTLAC